MPTLNSMPERSFMQNGQEWLYFSGTSYLGIQQNAQFQQYLQEGFKRYGTNFGGSRLSNLQFDIFEKAESTLAQWTDAPAALTVSSGTLAGQLTLTCVQSEDQIYYAPGTHPALWKREKPKKTTFEDWANKLIQLSTQKKTLILCANSIDPLRLEKYDFSFLQEINSDCFVTIIIDDSHGIGITGNNGAGIYTQIPKRENINLIVVASLGKALGLPGGVILADQAMIEKIQKSPLFGGASPMIPAYLYAYLQGQNLYRLALARLQTNIQHFTTFAEQSKLFKHQAHYPVFYTSEASLASKLETQQILISSFSYPSTTDPLINRVVLNALHTKEDISSLIKAISSFYVKLKK